MLVGLMNHPCGDLMYRRVPPVDGETTSAGAVSVTDDNDELGDRMKAYEAVETARALDKTLPIYARIDGRSFSGFTRAMERPFDPRMTAAMIGTTKHLVNETDARIGYTQSDEISLVWLHDSAEREPIFAGKVHKMTSILASMAAACFQRELWRAFDPEFARDRADAMPHFDARVFQLPNKVEAANALLWRAMDARKNAVSMATRSVYPAEAMHGAGQSEMREMLRMKGIEFEDYPAQFKWGTWVRRVAFERMLTAEDLKSIPEKYRPPVGKLITRSEVREISMPEFYKVTNRVEVIFDGADPQL
jgi:tRNA(His) guanylyltransferase